jgi:uncharacterized membrane protein
MKSSSKVIALSGVMGALTFVVMFLETYVFTVLIPLAPPCFLSISLAITLSLAGEKKYMFIGGTILGVCSLITAFIIGNPVFILPWISILPRIFIGIVAYWVAKLVEKIFTKAQNKFVKNYIPAGVGAIFGVVTNTVLTLTMMFLCKFVGVEGIIATFMAINFPIEVVASAILVPILVNTLRRFNKVR